MSQWTHITGVIRFDSILQNMWPEPFDKTNKAIEETAIVHDIFQRGKEPEGSEGPVKIDTILTNRGPTVVITGDLRSFGVDDLKDVTEWLQGRTMAVEKDKRLPMLMVRDTNIICDVEYIGLYLITHDHDYKTGINGFGIEKVRDTPPE